MWKQLGEYWIVVYVIFLVFVAWVCYSRSDSVSNKDTNARLRSLEIQCKGLQAQIDNLSNKMPPEEPTDGSD